MAAKRAFLNKQGDIMKITNKTISILVIITIALITINTLNTSNLDEVKSGAKSLYCATNGNYRRHKIDPDKIIGVSDGRWEFINGSATNCRLK